MNARRIVSLFTVSLCVGACSDDTSSTQDSGVRDQAGLSDTARGDQSSSSDVAGADQGLSSDLLLGDQALAPDLTLADQAVVSDLAGVDLTLADASQLDSTLPLDQAAVLDSSVDSPVPQSPCAQGVTPSVLIADTMVACGQTSPNANQCDAGALCGPGWHLCTATEYKVHFSSSAPSLSGSYWLASCVRDGSGPFAPTDTICSSCAGATGGDADVGWACSASIHLSVDELQVGLRSSGSCGIAGVNASANEAYWQPWTTDSLLVGGVCCK